MKRCCWLWLRVVGLYWRSIQCCRSLFDVSCINDQYKVVASCGWAMSVVSMINLMLLLIVCCLWLDVLIINPWAFLVVSMINLKICGLSLVCGWLHWSSIKHCCWLFWRSIQHYDLDCLLLVLLIIHKSLLVALIINQTFSLVVIESYCLYWWSIKCCRWLFVVSSIDD